jgi:hypothetical protein
MMQANASRQIGVRILQSLKAARGVHHLLADPFISVYNV